MDTAARGIVVGYNGSPGSEVALDWAAAAAQRQDKPLTIVCCVDVAAVPIEPVYTIEHLPEVDRQAVQAIVDTGVERAGALVDPARISSIITVGSPAAALVLASDTADLVVTGSRGRGRLAAGLLGSVSYAVTAHATCPVVVVRGDSAIHPDAEHAVIVGVDGSDASRRAVDLAAEIAATSGASLVIAGIGHLRSPEGWAYVEDQAAGTEHSHAVRQAMDEAVAAAEQRVRDDHGDLKVETDVLFGDPGHVLGELGLNAGVVVVGSRGRGGFAGLLLGSVSHTVIHEAPCPVVVVR